MKTTALVTVAENQGERQDSHNCWVFMQNMLLVAGDLLVVCLQFVCSSFRTVGMFTHGVLLNVAHNAFYFFAVFTKVMLWFIFLLGWFQHKDLMLAQLENIYPQTSVYIVNNLHIVFYIPSIYAFIFSSYPRSLTFSQRLQVETVLFLCISLTLHRKCSVWSTLHFREISPKMNVGQITLEQVL